MRLRSILALLAAAVAVGLYAAPAAAQAVPPVGAIVKDKAGLTIGVVERVVLGQDGRPYQLMIRQGPVLRPLLIEAISAKGGAYVTVLSKAEFEILPTAE